MKMLVLAGVALFLVVAPGWAEQGEEGPSEADIKREDAHRTVFRRFSALGAAATDELGLSTDGTAFVNLYLDLRRNHTEREAGHEPASRIFPISPARTYERRDDGLHLTIASGSFVIDAARLPEGEIVEAFRQALDAKAFDAARVSSDARERFAIHRRSLVGLLLERAGDLIAADEERDVLYARAGRDLLRGADEDPPGAWIYLGLLSTVGGEELASDLLARIARSKDDADPDVFRAYQRALCSITGPTARAYVESLIRGDDDRARTEALHHVRQDLSPQAMARLSTWAAGAGQDDDGSRHHAALMALGRTGTDASWKAMEDAFEDAEEERRLYAIAREMLRRNGVKGRAFLDRRRVDLESGSDPASEERAAHLRVLLDMPPR